MASNPSNVKKPTGKPQRRVTENKADVICHMKYYNTLPDVPFDVKSIFYQLGNQRFASYKTTSLERKYRPEILAELDLGVRVDLVDQDIYKPTHAVELHPDDERLLEDDDDAPAVSARSLQHARKVSWMRKPEYISTEQTRFQPQHSVNIESKIGFNVKNSLREESLHSSREDQIKAIEKTFRDAKLPIVNHHSKPHLVPVEVLPFFPDFANWKQACTQVVFDSDPAPKAKDAETQTKKMTQAMIRGMSDATGEQFVAYFVPTDETIDKRRQDEAAELGYKIYEEYEYKSEREYNWHMRSKLLNKGVEENYCLIERADGMFYNELETKVMLSKRRLKAGHHPSNTKLIVKHRELLEAEKLLQQDRESQLQPYEIEEDEPEPQNEEIELNQKKVDESVAAAQTTSDQVENIDVKNKDNESSAEIAQGRVSRSTVKTTSKTRSNRTSNARPKEYRKRQVAREPSKDSKIPQTKAQQRKAANQRESRSLSKTVSGSRVQVSSKIKPTDYYETKRKPPQGVKNEKKGPKEKKAPKEAQQKKISLKSSSGTTASTKEPVATSDGAAKARSRSKSNSASGSGTLKWYW